MQDALRGLYDAHIQASLTYDERRFTLLQYFLVGLAAIYAFWFNIKDPARQKVLFKPLIVSSIGITVFAVYLVFVYSKDSHEYFMYADKAVRQIYDITVGDEKMKRVYFEEKWIDVKKEFWRDKAVWVLLIWIMPMVFYSAVLSFAAFVVRRGKTGATPTEKSGQIS